MALVTGFLYVVGGLAALASGSAGLSYTVTPTLILLGVVAITVGLCLVRWGRLLPSRAYHLVFVAGTMLIFLGALSAPDPATAVAISCLFTFVALAGFFYFSWSGAVAHLLGALVACPVALQVRPRIPTGTWLALDLSCLGVAAVVGALAHRASSAAQDPVTELANRRGLDEALEELLRVRVRTGEDLGAALLDIDHFKVVNDTHGHSAGDQLLRRLGLQWRPMLPPGAVLARHGGDEFALLLPGHSAAAAHEVVERLRAVAEIGLSCGVTAHHEGETASQLLRRADRALYQAKSAGRGRTVLDDKATADALAIDLERAIELAEEAGPLGGTPEADGLRVFYQPVVDLRDGSTVGVEALARWTHPAQGPVPPGRFIPVAEESGLITRLGGWVAGQAFHDLAALRDRTGHELLLTVNVSGLQLCDPLFPSLVRTSLERSGWDASSTVLEVTESLVDAESASALAALTLLRDSGLRVAIDDFGTGYSALSRLDTLPTDYLKLDCSFVAPVATSLKRAQLLESILMLARAFGLAVIAEGVETEEQAVALRRLGCPLAQGYHFARPAPIEMVSRLLAARCGSTPPAPVVLSRDAVSSPIQTP